jgi:6-phosphogluconolactonase (cycloisomerase 2 family)
MKKKLLMSIWGAAALMIPIFVVRASEDDKDIAGAVYAMTNDGAANEVVVFDRDEKGLLTRLGSIATQGMGSGGGLDPLASQGSLVMSPNQTWLLAVNAGSNDISVFRVLAKGLRLVDKIDSGGTFPVSVTIFHDLVYVLNAGASPNISGFYLSHRGELIPLPNSTRALSAGGFGQVGFDPEGKKLVVTDKANNNILVYSIDNRGLPSSDPVVSPSNGLTPFAFIFDNRGRLLVVEAGSNAVSSYNVLHDGTLKVIDPSVPNGQRASCWIAGNKRGFVFTGNPGTSSISSYKLRTRNGTLSLLDGAAGTGNTPLDIAIPVNGRFLYALDPGNSGIAMFEIEGDGSLTNLGTVPGGISLFANGITAR